VDLRHGAWIFGDDATADELATANAVVQELEHIGAHAPDVVARWMRVCGLRGVMGDVEQCLITTWLRQVTGDPLLQVGRYHVTGYRSTPDRSAPIKVWRIDNPPAILPELIRRFDDGTWPELLVGS
jgi:hypothetical protein